MSSCDNSNIKQNYIVTNTNEFDTLTACTGIWTSNIYGCSPITIQDQLKLNSVSVNNSLTKILVIDNTTGLIQYRDSSSLISGNTDVISFNYNNKNTFTITRSDSVSFSATINTVSGFTIDGNLTTSGYTFVGTDIEPINDNVTEIGKPLKRFRNINTVSGTSTVWTSTNQIITPSLNLGLDTLNNQRTINANNSIIQNDILNGGNY
jgi:hypothetical protein